MLIQNSDCIWESMNPQLAAPLFAGWDDTMIWSCLQGVMGHIYVDSLQQPRSAMALLGDFCFFAGEPKEALVAYKPSICQQDYMIMTAQTQGWLGLIEQVYGQKARKRQRYAFKKEAQGFQVEKLQGFVAGLSSEFTLCMIDRTWFHYCRSHAWCADFVSLYQDYETFQQLGLGVLALRQGEPVAGASSYSRYRDGIEIEIDTKEAYRRQGLATACAAKLMLCCLERGLYPSWDAHNEASAALAQKLGYQLEGAYTAYEIMGH